MRKALVLGGGGTLGVAWEVGLLSGLLDAGIDVRDADLVVGTSAGSIVGTRVADGQDVSQPAPGPVVELPATEGGADLAALVEVFRLWGEARIPAQMDVERLRAIGDLAVRARTAPAADWINAIASATGVSDWPGRSLSVVAVDTRSGERVIHSRESGVAFGPAVAASCAIPGMFPAVEIGGRHFMDGSVRSTTSADVALAVEPEIVLALMPMCRSTIDLGELAEACLESETRALRARGAQVICILPDGRDAEAIGSNLMDGARTAEVSQRARERGRALARDEASPWRP